MNIFGDDELVKYAKYIKVAMIVAFVAFFFPSISDFKDKKVTEAEIIGECAANSLLGSSEAPCNPIEIMQKSRNNRS